MASNVVLSNEEFNVVGKRPIRHDGNDKVTGRARYSADMTLPRLLHGKIHIGAVARPPGYLIVAVVADGPAADHVEFFI